MQMLRTWNADVTHLRNTVIERQVRCLEEALKHDNFNAPPAIETTNIASILVL
jgi:hypothetical protein